MASPDAPTCHPANISSNLGDGSNITRAEPTPVGAGKVWSRVAVGRTHTCGLAEEGGKVVPFCWGADFNGELGNGAAAASPMPALVSATAGNESPWVDLAAGLNHTCGVRQDGTLWCWGRNNTGQLGDGTNVSKPDPKQVLPAGAADWKEVAASGEYTCARRATGAVLLGQGVSACALKKNGDLYCWGFGGFGQLGLGSTAQFTTPQKVPSVGPWLKASFGNDHACGVRTDGRLLCWGASYYAQLGVGVPFVSTPTRVVDP